MKPKFKFALPVLTSAAERLLAAINDPDYSAAMTERLGADFATEFQGRLAAVPTARIHQGSQNARIADLTTAQEAAFDEMERLLSAARRSARLAFPGDTTRLREEFQVGVDTPKTLAAEVHRAGIVLAAVQTHADILKTKGWIARDTTALRNAIATLTGEDLAQEEAIDDRLNLTTEKIAAANTLYADCLAIQNAARLEYPAKVAGQPAHATERARFLLDEFPPRDRNEPDGGTQSPPPAE